MVTKFDIDKFDGKIGFAIWKVHMQAVLTHHGYKKAFRGIAHKPQSMSDEDLLELDEKALATIQLFLTREVLREIIHETTAAGLWLKLESLYMTKSLANKLRLKDRLYTFRMKLGTSVQDHLYEFITILIDLENLDVDIDDENRAVLLVISLLASYKHFKKIMLYGNHETLMFDDVNPALLSKQKYDDDVEPESGEELVARDRSFDRGESSNKNKKHRSQSREKYSNKSCKYCKKLGHIVSDCYKLKNKLEREGKGNNKKKPEKAAEVAIAKGDSNGDVYLAIDTEKSRDELKGNIQVKMHDGVVRTITEVRHVSDLKRNLISLSTLEAKYSGESGVMKIFNGALVLMKAIQSGNSVDYSNLRVYVHVNEGKLVPRAVKCIFMGYGSGIKDFVPPHNFDNNHTEGKVEFEFDVENSTHTQPPFNDEHIETQDDGNMPTSPQSQPQTQYLLAQDRERRQVNRPSRLEDYQCDLIAYKFAVAAHIENCEPKNYLEAISSPQCDKWVVAMEEEVKDGIPRVEINLYKARYIVRRFDQREGIDFNDVFSPVVRHTSIRVLLSFFALQDLELEQLDVKTSFLHGHLKEEIYFEQPEGFKVPGKEDHVYDRCSYDECVYLRKFTDGSFLICCKPVPTLLAPHFKLSSHECPKFEEDKEDMSHVSYSSAVGSLIYAMVRTRPDLAHDVSVTSRYMHNPGKMHWEVVKCILRYLKGASNIGLCFKKGRASPNEVVGYVDSNYAGDLDARKSLSSYIFFHCGSAIS
uniref:Retrovirus-related Pol polyprotein from transposon TNT 1-94 n=1 Tax=Tanacetum cinerariifolium TaxID=118510 RepID=A0A699HGN6_TANCI|nr:retrovirus-related Pol polyprotein from transposon TNT 1-94 [Tanacetum cinerariifolium]